MARYTASLTGTGGSVKISDVNRARDRVEYVITVMVTGTLGGGTFNVQISPDQGTTVANLGSGAVVPTYAAGQAYTFRIGAGHTNLDRPSIYVSLSGATGANAVINAWDNN